MRKIRPIKLITRAKRNYNWQRDKNWDSYLEQYLDGTIQDMSWGMRVAFLKYAENNKRENNKIK